MPKHHTRLDLLHTFSEYSPQVMSNGQIRMMCPFRENHADGSGQMSFFVSPNINAYHCFSCKAKGNLVRLLTSKFGVGYFDAVEAVQITEYTPEKPEFDLDVVWDFNKAPEEFTDRGFSAKTLRHFKVGLTSEGDIIIPYYQSFTKPSELLGYQKRWYIPDRGVRNNKGFDKRTYLYNLDKSFDYVVVVEGQSDVWRLYQYGYNAVAVMGSDLSFQQAKELYGFKKVYLAFDNDGAGRRATEIAYYILKNHVSVELVPYESKDPGECGKAAWIEAFNHSTDYIVYSMEMSLNWDGYLDMRSEVLREVSKRTPE